MQNAKGAVQEMMDQNTKEYGAEGNGTKHRDDPKGEIRVGFVGNPNCGKTTLFNAFTGANLKVANWPGVTVERVEGQTSYKGRPIKVIDLPGIYSLTSYTIEEIVTRRCIEAGEVDVIINVVDGPEHDGYHRGAGHGDRHAPPAGDAGPYPGGAGIGP